MSADVVGFVQTSTNLASIKTTKNSLLSKLCNVAQLIPKLTIVIQLTHYLNSPMYNFVFWLVSGWKANSDSALLTLAKQVFVSMFGEDPS